MDYIRRRGISLADEYFTYLDTPLPDDTFFQMDDLLSDAKLEFSLSEASIAEEFEHENHHDFTWNLVYNQEGEQVIQASWRNESRYARFSFTQNKIIQMDCNCGQMKLTTYSYLRYYYFQPHMCPHCMALWMWTRKQIRAENPGDHTDGHGNQLMKMLSGTVQSELAASVESDILDLKEPPVSVKQPVVDLIPRIVRENPLGLYFDLSVNGGKALLVKGFSDLVQAVDNEQMLTLGKSASPDFSKVTFTDRSQKWYDMIRDRVHIITSLNKSRNYGQYYYEIIPIGNSFALNGSVLDSLYALAEGTSVLYQTGRRNDVRYIHVGSYSPKASITLTPIKNGNKLSGITLEGKIPEFISGEQFQYFLDDHFFSQVSDDRFKYIRPFQKITSDSGHFRCTLGKTKFQEFMYGDLPALRESGQIDLNDNFSPLLENQLPPEPEFTFYVDVVDKQVTCRAVVQYGEYPPCALGFDVPDQYVKDTVQENRVLSAIRKYFPDTDSEKHLFVQTASDDNVIEIKTEGLPNLARFGIVNGSDAFRRIQFRQVPHASLTGK